MTRFLPIALTVALLSAMTLPLPVEAAGNSMRNQVATELPKFGFRDVDVDALSTGQVAHIHQVIYSGRSNGDIRAHVGSVLRRGFLQRAVDRILE